MEKKLYCAIGFNSRARIFFLEMCLLFSRKKAYFFSAFSQKEYIHGWFIKKNRISFQKNGIGEIKGQLYIANERALRLTNLFFDKYYKKSNLVKFGNSLFKTHKYEFYIKKKIVLDIYEVLIDLLLVKEFSSVKKVILIDTPLNRFVIDEFLKDSSIDIKIKWLNPFVFYIFEPLQYGIFIAKNVFMNGLAYRGKSKIKLYREAACGSRRPILRDDFMVDGKRFKKEEVVFYSRTKDKMRDIFASQLKDDGYVVIDLNKCSFNLRGNLSAFIRLFIIHPILLYFVLAFEKKLYTLDHMFRFYKDSLPHFLFLSNYEPRCHISNADRGEIAETLVMNRFGCKNMIYHWSDMTVYKNVWHAFTIHNVYYTWGPIHHDYQSEDYAHDKVQVVGCVFLDPKKMDLPNNGLGKTAAACKKILVCDESFNAEGIDTGEFYLKFLDLIIGIMDEVKNCDVILKTKSMQTDVLSLFLTEEKRNMYVKKIKYLTSDNRFSCYDYAYPIESLIQVSDIVVTMGVCTPSTIALISDKEAVYYDLTGNDRHPLMKYKNKVIFDNDRLLIDQVKAILKKEDSVFNYIDGGLLHKYDSFRDSHALERLTAEIYKEANA